MLVLTAPSAASPRRPAHPEWPSQSTPRIPRLVLRPLARRRGDIQGLRAVAVLLVAFDHARVPFLPGGFVGVDVFFVISGFLITQLLLSRASTDPGAGALIDFYARRARRILPAAALTLVTCDVVATVLLNFVRARAILRDSISASLFTANFHFAAQGADYFALNQPPSPLQHFWSLAVEEQFYLVWPVLLMVVLFGVRMLGRRIPGTSPRRLKLTPAARRRLAVALGLIIAASLAWSIVETGAAPTSAYFSTFTRAWELGLGAALALCSQVAHLPHEARTAIGWLGLAAIVYAGISFTAGTPFPGAAALVPTVGAALVIAAGCGRGEPRLAVARLLALRPMRFIGDRSYAFYLWHWPVLIIAFQYVGHPLSVGDNLLLLGGAAALSSVSYRFFENPLRRRRSGVARSLALWPVSVTAVLIVAGVGIGRSDAMSARLDRVGAPTYPGFTADDGSTVAPRAQLAPAPTGQPLAAVAAAAQAARGGRALPTALVPNVAALATDYFSPPDDCSPGLNDSRALVCRLGGRAEPASHRLLLFGDSHAQMWVPAIRYLAARDHWGLSAVWKSGCSPDEWWDEFSPTPAACRAWLAPAIAQVIRQHARVILLPLNVEGVRADGATAAGVRTLVGEVRAGGARVIVVQDDYAPSRQPVDCLLAGDATMGSCAGRVTASQLAVAQTIESAAVSAGAAYMPTAGWFCDGDVCPLVVNHTVTHLDDAGHITATYSSELGRAFEQEFDRTSSAATPGAGAAT